MHTYWWLALYVLDCIFTYWIVLRDGAEVLEGSKSYWLFVNDLSFFGLSMTAHEIRVGTAITWIATTLFGLLVLVFPDTLG